VNIHATQLDILCHFIGTIDHCGRSARAKKAHPLYIHSCHFIIKVRKDVSVENIIRPFKQCRISSLMEDMEENLLWQDEGDTEVEVMSYD
jgi:hypothetical protein